MLTLKPSFQEYIQELLPDEQDRKKFFEFCEKPTRNVIRCNTLKIAPEELKTRLEKKWKIFQAYKDYPEIFVISNDLKPGELGKTIEHQLGLYYVQELSSMTPPIALSPAKDESVLDLCAAPGSKTTQISNIMQNSGFLLANDPDIRRLKALSSNLDRCGCMNTIISRMNGSVLCERLASRNILFDKILVDAPCSGEGVIRSDPKILETFNPKVIKKISSLQKKLIASALKCLKLHGILVYSTCTFEPQENEEVIQFALDNFPVQVQEFELPLKTRQGILKWQDKTFNKEIEKCKRLWPQDNDTEGFFVAKLKKYK
jgi:NOL1/NOP2/sun family putative RNA methylase